MVNPGGIGFKAEGIMHQLKDSLKTTIRDRAEWMDETSRWFKYFSSKLGI